MLTLGTESELEFVHNFENKNNVEELKENVTAKWDSMEADGF